MTSAKMLRVSMLVALLPSLSLAEDAKAKAAREELEKQLSQMVGKQPTRVRIDVIGLDDPNYKLEEASFELDGRVLNSPLPAHLADEGSHPVWEGDASPGKHVVKVRLVFANGTSVLLSDEGGYKWRIGGEVSFDLNSGIEVRVAVTPKRDSAQKDIAKRFRLSLPATPVMIARLDDGTMPEAPPKPNLPVEEVDAGVAVAALTPAEEKKKAAEAAAEVKRLAEEEKKAKAEAAAELKRVAAAERKAKAEAAALLKREAAEEKKRKAAEALEAKRAAADEKKRAAAEAAEAKRVAALEAAERKKHPELANSAPTTVDAGTVAVAVVDAGSAEEPVDAGVAVAVAPTPVAVDAGSAPIAAAVTPPAEESSLMPVFIGAGVGLLVVGLIVLARRRARPPSID